MAFVLFGNPQYVSVFLKQLDRSVGRSAVDDNVFPPGVILRPDAFNGLTKGVNAVKTRVTTDIFGQFSAGSWLIIVGAFQRLAVQLRSTSLPAQHRISTYAIHPFKDRTLDGSACPMPEAPGLRKWPWILCGLVLRPYRSKVLYADFLDQT